MRALVWDGSLRLDTERPAPEPVAGEALIRVTLAGICGTDLAILDGYGGFEGVPGHEFVGVVETCATEADLVGQRVVGEINVACGVCDACNSGRRNHCPARTALGIRGRDGAFAEYVALPSANLHRVPSALPDETAVFTEPLAAACRILDQVSVGPDVRAVVVGDGRLGLLCAQVLAQAGCRTAVLGRHPDKLAIAAARGIETSTDASEFGRDADLVVEATGAAGALDTAVGIVRPGGTVVLKSTRAPEPGGGDPDLSRLVVDEITLIGSRCGPFSTALHFLEQGLVDVEPLVHARYPLDRGVEAFDHAARSGTLKVLLEVG